VNCVGIGTPTCAVIVHSVSTKNACIFEGVMRILFYIIIEASCTIIDLLLSELFCVDIQRQNI
jgi:hypothetical protein